MQDSSRRRHGSRRSAAPRPRTCVNRTRAHPHSYIGTTSWAREQGMAEASTASRDDTPMTVVEDKNLDGRKKKEFFFFFYFLISMKIIMYGCCYIKD